MITDEFKEQIFNEIIICKELNELTLEIKDIFLKLIMHEIERFILNDEEKIIFENNAYIACSEHALKFNPNKTNNAYAYIATIIRSSFSDTIVKLKHGYEI